MVNDFKHPAEYTKEYLRILIDHTKKLNLVSQLDDISRIIWDHKSNLLAMIECGRLSGKEVQEWLKKDDVLAGMATSLLKCSKKYSHLRYSGLCSILINPIENLHGSQYMFAQIARSCESFKVQNCSGEVGKFISTTLPLKKIIIENCSNNVLRYAKIEYRELYKKNNTGNVLSNASLSRY